MTREEKIREIEDAIIAWMNIQASINDLRNIQGGTALRGPKALFDLIENLLSEGYLDKFALFDMLNESLERAEKNANEALDKLLK